MGEAEKYFKGPFLISRSDLEELDKVLEIIFQNLNKAWDKEIELNPEKANRRSPIKKSIVLKSKNRTQLSDETVLGILINENVDDFEPSVLKIEIGDLYSRFYFSLLIMANNIDGDIDYSVVCENEAVKREIVYEIDKWVEGIAPNKIVQFWSNTLPIILYTIGVLWIILLSISLFKTPTEKYNEELNEKAKALIENGINESNKLEALEIVLKHQTNYIQDFKGNTWSVRPNIMKALIVSIALFIILNICPKTTIGVGKHKKKLRFYLSWNKLVMVTIPLSIFLPIISDWVSSLIK